ncbi:MAG: hypothetical protein CBB68_02495 [Rhodospirillaceae bacterium TMED8]|nr:hypothetical protein [Magnetovibrio sp.]OUT52244.1 MAG: hypothetical protein CBB68_02495 [Rhodospirillaceae bacterium TMED8]
MATSLNQSPCKKDCPINVDQKLASSHEEESSWNCYFSQPIWNNLTDGETMIAELPLKLEILMMDDCKSIVELA